MAIGLIMVMFVGMSAISIVGMILLLLVKNETVKRRLFYVMCAWGMVVAILSANSLPANWTGQQILAWGMGFLSVAGGIVHVKAKTRYQYLAAYGLVAVSCIGGVLKMFII
ncbi:hypothetical protein FND36_04455 [Lachnospiraceae bacterium KGMB03038]|nr:hypothetical protein FND36_04455 [Lachnospiraceae bacterium KGMB03038]